MSAVYPDPDRDLAEINRLVADTLKLQAEAAKLSAERDKLEAERRKLARDTTWQPIAVGAGAVVGGVTALLAVLKAFSVI